MKQVKSRLVEGHVDASHCLRPSATATGREKPGYQERVINKVPHGCHVLRARPGSFSKASVGYFPSRNFDILDFMLLPTFNMFSH